jgi:hypothetical protein
MIRCCLALVAVAVALAVAVEGCGRDPDFQVPPRPDMRTVIDLAVSLDHPPADMTCFNTACGGCSAWARVDGKPAQPGDPCLWKGTWQCMGTTLVCSDTGCPACGGAMTGSVCGADGHTVLDLTMKGGMCAAYDFGSTIALCNHDASDHCVGRCIKVGASYACTAGCTSEGGGDGGARDGGAPRTGCPHAATDTCDTLTSC